jgi:hypothetical protein
MSENSTRGLLIGGQEVAAAGGGVTADISPWTGEPYAQVAAGTPGDVTAAIDAAQAAFPAWSAMGAYDRRDIFLRAADLMAAREERAIATMAGEVGAARPWAAYNVALCVEILREAAAAVTRPNGELLATAAPGAYSVAQRVPLGVVAAISSWNASPVAGRRLPALPRRYRRRRRLPPDDLARAGRENASGHGVWPPFVRARTPSRRDARMPTCCRSRLWLCISGHSACYQ